MIYTLRFSSSAHKKFSKLDEIIKKRIFSSLKRLRIRPKRYLVKIIDGDSYRLRVGEYRVIVDLIKEQNLILITNVGHRKSIYK